MQQFRNWRWYKGLGGGPLAELGSHQVDVFNWFMGVPPKSVIASGNTDYYDRETHECNDTVMVIYEYETKKGDIRAFYQTINANSSFGYFENFMGDEGTLYISEAGGRAKVYREPAAPDWDKWVKIGYLKAVVKEEKKPADAVLDIEETVEPPSYLFPVQFNDPIHKPHLENFFNAIRGSETLNYPADIAYPTTVSVLKVDKAVENAQKIQFRPEDFQV
jgi:predicted dehydrogenase